MCQPFNEHQSFNVEFHGLLMYIFAVTSVYFMIYIYKPPRTSAKTSKNHVKCDIESHQEHISSTCHLEYQKSHKFREEQRAKYRRHKTFKKGQSSETGSQGSLVKRTFTFRKFNNSPFNTPKLVRHNPFSNTHSSSLPSMIADETNEKNFNEQYFNSSQILSNASSETSNDFSVLGQSNSSDLNAGYLRSERGNEALRFMRSDTLEGKQHANSLHDSLITHQSSTELSNASRFNTTRLTRNDAFDACHSNSLHSIVGATKSTNESNQNKTNFDRKSSLRRKALSVEMLKHSSEESNTITVHNNFSNKRVDFAER